MKIKSKFYSIAYSINNSINPEDCFSKNNFKVIRNPLFRWNADPFLFTLNNRDYIICESANFITGKGKFYYCCLSERKLKWKSFKTSLKCHVSFPNVFKTNDSRIYMIPESSEDRKVYLLYLSDQNKWLVDRVLINNSKCVDTVIGFRSNKPWIATYCLNNIKSTLNIYLQNTNNDYSLCKTIIDDTNCLRPAGNIYVFDNKEILVGQKGNRYYGEGLVFYSIDCDYLLTPICCYDGPYFASLFNDKHLIGVHTFNSNERYIVIDLQYEKFSFLGLIRKILFKLFGLGGYR